MMDFNFTEEQLMLRELARKFANKEVRPLADQIDKEGEVPLSLIKKAGDLGLLAVPFPEEYGGGGLGEIGYCLVLEEIAQACFSTVVVVGGHVSIGAMAIYLGGNPNQKAKYLPDLCSGKKLSAYALTEPQAGSDASAIRSFAERKSDRYILNGQKTFITNGGIADVYSVFASTDRSAGIKGITAFIVEKDYPGFRAGKPEMKMGIHGSPTTDLFFEDVEVPIENRLGDEGEGFSLAMRTLDRGRLSLGAQCLGAAKEVLRLSVKHSQEREQFGAPIAKQQAIQWMLAEMSTDIFAMESITYRGAWMCDNNIPYSRQSAQIKLFCSEALGRCVDKAVQIHGGMGYISEYPIERFYRDARITRIFEGTNEIQKIVIAKDVLRSAKL
jgi:alkylation response protein AidB-like acyl-CoA dehydrogenase